MSEPVDYCSARRDDGLAICRRSYAHDGSCEWTLINNTPPAPKLGCDFGVALNIATQRCAECANEMHKVIDRKGGFVCSSLRCARYGVRQ